ncbi:zinc finger C2HC domain-containing protein 1A isoform X1 [Syngnathus scovelli]|uniref:zinc finger C2HC domain-containing protein 1A isoform X1 n=1 Tax=Syngnathus scovelli TaxID=161590 RepID=UPI0021109CDA|nr:zinc finger C2HC domain-containing protein 1A isoform X1 [Syngnathus scovelli]
MPFTFVIHLVKKCASYVAALMEKFCTPSVLVAHLQPLHLSHYCHQVVKVCTSQGSTPSETSLSQQCNLFYTMPSMGVNVICPFNLEVIPLFDVHICNKYNYFIFQSQSSSAQKAEPPKKPSNWRKKHEDFLAVLKLSKANARAMKEGGPLHPPPAPTFDPDLVKCPYCQRRFNENSAQGHIKFCQDQASRMSNRNKSDAKKAPARPQYKPPPLVKKVNSVSSSIPSASSRLPARSGLSQPTGVLSSKTSPAASMRTNANPSPSPSSGVGIKNRVVSSGYGSVRNTTPVRGPLYKKKLEDTFITRDDVHGSVGNSDVKSKFCHSCGSRYPIEAAKFCCECGIRRLCI